MCGLTVLPAFLGSLCYAAAQVKSAAHGAAEEVEDEAKEHRTGLYTGEADAAPTWCIVCQYVAV
jgi:hypothetical protein